MRQKKGGWSLIADNYYYVFDNLLMSCIRTLGLLLGDTLGGGMGLKRGQSMATSEQHGLMRQDGGRTDAWQDLRVASSCATLRPLAVLHTSGCAMLVVYACMCYACSSGDKHTGLESFQHLLYIHTHTHTAICTAQPSHTLAYISTHKAHELAIKQVHTCCNT